MKIPLLAVAASAIALFTGCVSTKNVALTLPQMANFEGKSIAVTTRPLPDFATFKAGNAMFGLVGGLAAVAAGNDLVRTHDIKDPAVTLSQDLLQQVATSFKLVPQPNQAIAIDTADVLKIAEASSGKADLVLDVQTVNWNLIYLPTKWLRYRLIYSVKLRLIDVKKRALVAEGFHAWQMPEGAGFPTFDELVADNAALLRRQLEIGSQAAAQSFKSTVLIVN